MTIKIDHDVAKEVLLYEYEQAQLGAQDHVFDEWVGHIERLTELCPYRKSSTFIAAIGTALLAKSVDPRVDVYCLLDRAGSEDSYSARSLADGVWAKNRALLGIDLGANGANPLNNVPFMNKSRIDEIQNVRNVEGFECLQMCLDLLAEYSDTRSARSALRAFISVRRVDFCALFDVGENAGAHLTLPTLCSGIEALVAAGSEEGRCAQAVAAGLLSEIYGADCIEVGHVNDPDRHFPLDILIRAPEEQGGIVKSAVEVKDKPVEVAEVLSSVEKSIKLEIFDIIFLAISNRQKAINFDDAYIRARDMGCRLVIYTSWDRFVTACMSFVGETGQNAFATVYSAIGAYLVEMGVSQEGVNNWKAIAYP